MLLRKRLRERESALAGSPSEGRRTMLGRVSARVRSMLRLAMHWKGIVTGDSYWHQPQNLGKKFVPGHLEGYFNDLTLKVNWKGPADAAGNPLLDKGDGCLVAFPTTIFQKALAHWDCWLESGRQDADHYDRFLVGARWALERIDPSGGWSLWGETEGDTKVVYSAMTQGEGASVLVRAYASSGDDAFLRAARLSIDAMMRPIRDGGTSRQSSNGFVLEELPTDPPNTILNGWIFGLFGAYDYLLVAHDPAVQRNMDNTVVALAETVPNYDAGYWSYYDLAGNVASPFYHLLHIAQLQAVEHAFPSVADRICRVRRRFEGQAQSRSKMARAVCYKAYQKILQPPDVVLR